MIFGESFQEPPVISPAKNFSAFAGQWRVADAELSGSAGDGPKLVSSTVAPFADGEASVEINLPSANNSPKGEVHNAGLILRVARPGIGADEFDGYEIALDAGRQVVGLGRHQHDYTLLKEAACDIPS